jgi:hypothetical protein
MGQLQAAVRRLMADAQKRYERRYKAWLARKIATAAQVMDRPVEFFLDDAGRPLWALLGYATAQPGWPADFPPEPQFDDCVDKRREAALYRMVERAQAMRVEELDLEDGLDGAERDPSFGLAEPVSPLVGDAASENRSEAERP